MRKMNKMNKKFLYPNMRTLKAATLSGTNLCLTKKKLNLDVKGSVLPAWQRSRITKDAIRKYLYLPQELKTIDEVKNYIASEMDELSFESTETKERQIWEAQTLAVRYLKSGYVKPCVEPAYKYVKAFDTLFGVKPDFVYEDVEKNFVHYKFFGNRKQTSTIKQVNDKKTITLVKFFAGKQGLSSNGRTIDTSMKHNLEVMSLLLYGLEMLGNDYGSVIVRYDYLKSDIDKADDYSAKWQYALSKSTKKDHSVWLKVDFKNKQLIDPSDKQLFENYKDSFELYNNGVEKCSQAMCEKCDNFALCSHVHPPMQKNQEQIVKQITDYEISPEQEKIIKFDKGIARANCGAGAGKTFVTCQRIINLIINGANPKGILMTTFTNAGVEEMKSRIRQYIEDLGLPVNPDDITIQTFNGLGGMLIEKYYKELGFTEEPTLVDDVEKMDMISAMIKTIPVIKGLDYKNPLMNISSSRMGVVPYLNSRFDEIRSRNYSKSGYASHHSEEPESLCNEVYDACCDFSKRMREKNFVDFSDQVNLVGELLDMYPNAIADTWQIEHLTVDEFQDSNDFQMDFIRELMGTAKFKSLLVVGDDSQSIFGFRGTSPKCIINFDKIMNCKVKDFYLNESYRSTKKIVELANEVIAQNTNRINKQMTSSKDDGEIPTIKGFDKNTFEIKYIADKIEDLLENGERLEDIAFISFKRNTLKLLQKELSDRNILSLTANPESLLTNSRVISAIALAEYFNDPESTRSLMIYLNELYGGDKFLLWGTEKVQKIIDRNIKDFTEIVLPLSQNEQLDLFLNLISVLDDGTDEIYTSFLNKVKQKKKYSLSEILNYMIKFKLYNTKDEIKREGIYEAVTLVTAHSSKGREWKHCFVSLSDFDSLSRMSLDEIEERRRLIFVAVTRARDTLTITSTRMTESKSELSAKVNRFFDEMKTLPGVKLLA